MTTQDKQIGAQAGEPNGDTIREIARKVRNLNGPSDTTSPEQYVAGGWLAALQFHGPAIAKKDAALRAAVEALKIYQKDKKYLDVCGPAITQAEEALK